MSLFDRFRRGPSVRMRRPAGDATRTGSTTVRASSSADTRHLNDWVVGRRGVEGFVEPRTAVNDVTLLLVAHDGEWTRRRIEGEKGARRLGKDLAIPVYDVHKVGYPQRMRDHDARTRILRDRERRSGL